MQILTYNEILTKLCDDFEELIAPRTIARSNTNVIYLMFKAIAKGYEVINNICVVLSNKFDPSKCSDEDLESVANLVGTERYKGSASGLYITVKNDNEDSSKTMYAGTYVYTLDEQTVFTFEVTSDTKLLPEEEKTFIAMSDNIGSYPVTAQSSIEVTADVIIDSDLSFRCADNESLLGIPAETDLDFRKRILSNTNRQDSLTELQTSLRNLPYLFDAQLKFNNTFDEVTYDGITIPPSCLAIFYSGEPRKEIAEVVASKDIFPTVRTSDSVKLVYENDVFINGGYEVNIIPFKKYEYSVKVEYKIEESFITAEEAAEQMGNELKLKLNTMVHKDFIKETDIYAIINAMNIAGVEVLNVDLKVAGETVSYINVPLSRIPELIGIDFAEVS